jgi:carboxypeptidase Taq
MFLETMEKDIPNWKDEISNGSVEIVINWLKENIHFKANLYDPGEMMEKITGKRLTAEPFIVYLEKKYSSIFD